MCANIVTIDNAMEHSDLHNQNVQFQDFCWLQLLLANIYNVDAMETATTTPESKSEDLIDRHWHCRRRLTNHAKHRTHVSDVR